MKLIHILITIAFFLFLFSCKYTKPEKLLIGKWSNINRTGSKDVQIIFYRNKTVTLLNIVNGDTTDFANVPYTLEKEGKEIVLQQDANHKKVKMKIEALTETSLVLKRPEFNYSLRYEHIK